MPEEVQALVDAVVARWGGVDVLLNVAGGWSGGKRLADTSDQEWQAALNRNLTTTFLINRAVLPSMLKRGWGRIVNVGSKAAEQPGPRQAAYNVAKAGVVALTQSIAADYRRQGICANVLLPSIIDTAQIASRRRMAIFPGGSSPMSWRPRCCSCVAMRRLASMARAYVSMVVSSRASSGT